MNVSFRRPTRMSPAALALIGALAVLPSESNAQQLGVSRFAAATAASAGPSAAPPPLPDLEPRLDPGSLYLRSAAGSALGMGLSLGVAAAMAPSGTDMQAYFDILLNGFLVGSLASTAGAVIGARSAATEERPVSTGRALSGAALGVVPGYVAGLVGGLVGAVAGGEPGVVVGFTLAYAAVQGVPRPSSRAVGPEAERPDRHPVRRHLPPQENPDGDAGTPCARSLEEVDEVVVSCSRPHHRVRILACPSAGLRASTSPAGSGARSPSQAAGRFLADPADGAAARCSRRAPCEARS